MNSTASSTVSGSGARRARYGLQAAVLLLAVTAACVFAVLIAGRLAVRLDVTATREHRLSERTTRILKDITQPYEIVIAANYSTLDPQAARRTQGVLENFERASPNLRATVIDVGAAQGPAQLDALLSRLQSRFAPALDQQRKALDAVRQNVTSAQNGLRGAGDQIAAANVAIKGSDAMSDQMRQFLADAAAASRIGSEDLGKALAEAERNATRTIGSTRVSADDEVLAIMRKAINELLANVTRIHDGLDTLAKAPADKVPLEVSAACRPALETIGNVRGALGRAIAGADEAPRTPIAAVARLLERSSAAVIIGPPGAQRAGVTSIDLSSIYVPRALVGGDVQQVDLRARTEELISGALASLSRTDTPIVVFVHGRNVRIAPQFVPVAPIIDRLSLRGVDFAEWPAGLDDAPPALTSIDPSGMRPVVYILIAMAPGSAEDGARLGKLAAAASWLIRERKNVLVTAVPSNLPSIGQPDPMLECLKPLGVTIDTARPLLRQVTTERGRLVTSHLIITDPKSSHPVGAAIRSLNLFAPWSLPVRWSEQSLPKGVTVEPVILAGDENKSIWAESEWLGFLQTPEAQQSQLVNPPAADTRLDEVEGPFGGRWAIAAGVEVQGADKTAQRIMLVGCNRWMSGEVVGAEMEIEGRRVPAHPGNLEFMDAAVSWLARQDDLIASTPTAAAVPMMPPMSSGQMAALRWSLIAGLPAFILLLGAGWRLWRG